jgi:hypothetical protein
VTTTSATTDATTSAGTAVPAPLPAGDVQLAGTRVRAAAQAPVPAVFVPAVVQAAVPAASTRDLQALVAAPPPRGAPV